MRLANVVVTVLGLLATVVAVALSWRWRRLAVAGDRPSAASPCWRDDLSDAVRTLGALVSAGVIAGALVLGLTGRLVMRLLAVSSGAPAQGRLTEAGERVGEITAGGTIGFVIFVGLGGGVVAAFGFLVLRRWLPRQAGRAGFVVGVILLGTIGVLDPLASENVDFTILHPTALALGAVVATGLLFATTFVALAARLSAAATTARWTRWLPCVSLPLVMLPFLAPFPIAYIVGRVLARGRLRRVLARPVPMLIGHAAVAVVTAVTVSSAIVAAGRIATG